MLIKNLQFMFDILSCYTGSSSTVKNLDAETLTFHIPILVIDYVYDYFRHNIRSLNQAIHNSFELKQL